MGYEQNANVFFPHQASGGVWKVRNPAKVARNFHGGGERLKETLRHYTRIPETIRQVTSRASTEMARSRPTARGKVKFTKTTATDAVLPHTKDSFVITAVLYQLWPTTHGHPVHLGVKGHHTGHPVLPRRHPRPGPRACPPQSVVTVATLPTRAGGLFVPLRPLLVPVELHQGAPPRVSGGREGGKSSRGRERGGGRVLCVRLCVFSRYKQAST